RAGGVDLAQRDGAVAGGRLQLGLWRRCVDERAWGATPEDRCDAGAPAFHGPRSHGPVCHFGRVHRFGGLARRGAAAMCMNTPMRCDARWARSVGWALLFAWPVA